uniref:POX domain-containing protein n=1 Tax=Salix viminalis TaxID=40686 RepID=A0A6N2K6W1_SALVM
MAREPCEDKSRNMVSSGSFCYPDVSSCNPTIQTHLVNQIQGYESNPEIFNLTTGMEMIGKQPHPGGPSSSKTIHESTNGDFYQDEFNKPDFSTGISEASNENLMIGSDHSAPWQENRLLVDDSSLRCVFPCEGNERPSQGLSLSLSSSNPSSIGFHSFELRHNPTHQNQDNSQEEVRFFGKSPANLQQQMVQDGFLTKAANLHHQAQFQLRNSRYLGPAQDLLKEFCNLGTKQVDALQQKSHKPKQWDDDQTGSSSRKQSLQSRTELQKRKTKMLSMLEEKIQALRSMAMVSSFEAVAGAGAASVYSALASKAMSRHFRCLRDGIVAQIHATKKAMGEKDPVAPGTTKGETPRLKILDQALRQQRAFQQMSMMESHPWRPQRGLPERSVSFLRAWLFEHFLHPLTSTLTSMFFMAKLSQVSNWFINARVRLWKPMVEEMYLEETKEQGNNMASSDGVTDLDENINGRSNQNPSSTDQKPTPDQLNRIDSECLSSVISNPDKNDTNKSTISFQSHHLQHQQHNFGNFGGMDLDFSSYNHHTAGGVSYANDNASNQNFNGGGVSLTLGLQQHKGSGVSLHLLLSKFSILP